MPDIEMVPDAVHRAGIGAQDVATRVPAKNQHGFTTTEEAAYQHRDLASGQALESCRSAWAGRLQEISDSISATAEKLHQAAASATATDARAGADLDRAGTDLGWR